MAELNTLTEDAMIAWLQDSGTHEQTLAATVRRFAQAKFNELGEPDKVQLPMIVVKATRERQLHTNLGVWMFTVDVVYYFQADDTGKATWDAESAKFERVLTVDDLAGYLSTAVDGFKCWGVPTRMVGDKVIDGRVWRLPARLTLWAAQV